MVGIGMGLRQAFLALMTSFVAATAVHAAPLDCYVKRGTWQESLLASRETLLRQECRWDTEQLKALGVSFGDWYVAPWSPRDPAPAEFLQKGARVDLSKPLAFTNGDTVTLKKCPDLKPGVLFDASQAVDANSGAVLFYTTVRLARDLDKSTKLTLTFAMPFGTAVCPESGKASDRQDFGDFFVINRNALKLPSKKGVYKIVVNSRLNGIRACPVWYHPQVEKKSEGLGGRAQRTSERKALYDMVAAEFDDPASQMERVWDQEYDLWSTAYDWVPGDTSFLRARYEAIAATSLESVETGVSRLDGMVREAVALAVEKVRSDKPSTLEAVREKYYAALMIREVVEMARGCMSMELAVKDQQGTFGDRYPNGAKYLSEISELNRQLISRITSVLIEGNRARSNLFAYRQKYQSSQRRILLSNPLLNFNRLLLARGGMRLNVNWGGENMMGKEIAVLSPVSSDGKITTIHKGTICNFELDSDANKILCSDGRSIIEMDVDGGNARIIRGPDSKADPVRRYDACRMPNDDIMFVSTACGQAVPCIGGGNSVGNIHVMDKDGHNERRITFDQDHNWSPCVLNNGKVIYTRWEYADTPHFFTRLLFHMNPDGTNQGEYYGSNSYWPNSMFWPRPIPGHPTMVVAVVSGHHGTGRAGELVLLDPARGRHEADGVVQRIPGYGRKVEPIIVDRLVDDSWPKFVTPWPLGTSPEKDGAGKYFLATVKRGPCSTWELCLVDVFDNITTILEGEYTMPVPLLARRKPPVIPSRVRPQSTMATVLVSNVYRGPGLKGYPEGSVKALRIGSHHFRYGSNAVGKHIRATSFLGGWDVKRILGTVPVYEDGSAFFEVPANTPIFVQPLDAEGKALQVMRSWFSAMPGESLSCIGCHESQNTAPPVEKTIASRNRASTIRPWYGPARGFGFEREVQPVLNRKCVGCHDGTRDNPDFRVRSLRRGYDGDFGPSYMAYDRDTYVSDYGPSYMALQKYVRRPGMESDYHMPPPARWMADTSPLIKMLKKGHHNVRLTREEWERLYTWIDFNVPYPPNWTKSPFNPQPGAIETRANLMKQYASIDQTVEDDLTVPPMAHFETPPDEGPKRPAPSLSGWPWDADTAETKVTSLVTADRPRVLEVELSEDVTMKFTLIPAGKFIMGDTAGFPDEIPKVAAIDEPFYLGTTEVTLKQFQQFDPTHENGLISCHTKWNQTNRGIPMNEPDYPVVRISQQQAKAFCQWLSDKTGMNCSLPTEEQWEWACRAGTAGKYYFGELADRAINIAGEENKAWNLDRYERGYSDKSKWVASVAQYAPNTWGLYDMLGNVTEWTRSDYQPLEGIGVVKGTQQNSYKVVRGGSWNDKAMFATSASRWRYPSYQPVFDVGCRVMVQAPSDLIDNGRIGNVRH